MRAVIQRVTEASVVVDQNVCGKILTGLLVFLGVEDGDTEKDLAYILKKTSGLRIFSDALHGGQGKMNLSVGDVGGAVLVVSQFTLLGDVSQGNRPSFIRAAPPDIANTLYEEFVRRLRLKNIPVQTGIFGADMQVRLLNDGPVTISIDSRQK